MEARFSGRRHRSDQLLSIELCFTLGRYLPKSTDLSLVSRAELDRIQDSLNARPRKTLGYMTPSDKFAELVATTA